MNPDFLRYSCQMALPGFSETGQQELRAARVLIAGAGGLGCPAAQYLAAAGIGTLGIADFDVISISNLHRQILYAAEEAGMKKVIVACGKLSRQNPGINLVPHDIRITTQNVNDLISAYDIVVDGTDNFETRYLLNDACFLAGKPMVYGAIYQYEGQVALWNISNEDGSRSPNYRDLFPAVNAAAVPNCAEGGVLPTLAGIIGCMQAGEVIKYITGTGELLTGKVWIFDAQTGQARIIQLGRVTNTTITRLPETAAVATIAVAVLKETMHENRYELVDVRTNEERAAHHIGGIHIPLNEIEQKFNAVNGKPIVFYCATGKRSAEAARIAMNKFPGVPVFSLEGGLNAWKEKK